MARPINLILARHAVSEANLDKAVNARLPDAKVPLAPQGHKQARSAGDAIVKWLHSPANQFRTKTGVGRTRVMSSPYERTRETARQIRDALVDYRLPYDYREELALREISFGLFDGLTDEEIPIEFPREHAYYQKHVDFEGEFYAPMPMGESRIQVADRVKGVFGTILRDADPSKDDPVRNFIIVSHGVTIRTFIMQWLHRTPEWFALQKNPGNASVRLITSNGVLPYADSTIFDGFTHKRTKQDQREEGTAI